MDLNKFYPPTSSDDLSLPFCLILNLWFIHFEPSHVTFNPPLFGAAGGELDDDHPGVY